jgi:hypothetical protein
MLRRLETYSFRPDTTPEQVDELARVLRRTGWFIPEVLDSAVGRNRSSAGVDLVWEHSYESPEAYAHYMCQPFHICILDRYLLPEAPECITASRRELMLGLMGYEIDGAPFRRDGGIRRIVALKASSPDFDAFAADLEAKPGLAVSVVAPNTMGLEWFPTGWTHLWEQAYDDDAAMEAAIADEAELLAGGPVSEWIDIHYVIEREDAPAEAAR